MDRVVRRDAKLSYTVAKSLLTTFLISTLSCHSDRYMKVSYPIENRENLMEVYINPMIGTGVLEMTEPDNPTSRNQMYVTVKVEQDLQK